MIGARRFEQHFRSVKVRPDPLMEFVLGWLRRHPLPASDREAPVVWDSGRFHHEHGHLVALIDLELGHVGDPMMDLAAWRMRDTVIPYGDFTALYDRYAELTGRPVDLTAIRWHHLFFTLTNQLSSPVAAAHEHLSRSLRSISPGDAYVAYQVRIAFRQARHLERFDQIAGTSARRCSRASSWPTRDVTTPSSWCFSTGAGSATRP